MAIAYFQPVTRGEVSGMFGREISRDLIASPRAAGLIATGPRSRQPGAPYACVTRPGFLSPFGFESLRDLPDLEKLEDAGLLDWHGPDAPDPDRTRNVNSVELFSGQPCALRGVVGDELAEDAA